MMPPIKCAHTQEKVGGSGGLDKAGGFENVRCIVFSLAGCDWMV